jgi:hypothetical protein
LWSPGEADGDYSAKNTTTDGRPAYLLDGRNRLDAMELVGLKTLTDDETLEAGYPGYIPEHVYAFRDGQPWIDPFSYVIAKNIRRRHLNKEQQAELIVKVIKAQEEAAKKDELIKNTRSFSPTTGKRGGSTKDPVKEKIIEETKRLGISKDLASE